jgi:hypothetical protein
MKPSVVRTSLLLALMASGCAAPGDPPKTDDSLGAYVLAEVPTDVQHRTLVDFGGAIHLVGWDLSPTDLARPGSTLHLKLYWRSVKPLSPGWKFFTHITTVDAPKPYAFDDVGPLRQKLTASDLVPGNVYVDEQDLTVPAETEGPTVTLSVGVGHAAVQEPGAEIERLPSSRLEIISGVTDGQNRAVLTRLNTGYTPGQKADPRGDRRRPLPPNFKGRPPIRPQAPIMKENP